MRNSRVDVSEEPLEMPMPGIFNDKSRFLKRRTQKNVDNGYHPSHDPKSVAEIPEIREGEVTEEDNDMCVLEPPEQDVPDEEIARLKQQLPHLSFDTAIQVLAMYEYDVDTAIEVGRQMAAADLVPSYVKDMIVANIAVERSMNPTRALPYKDFYFAKDLSKVVGTESLVNCYYSEKNKIGGNWRLERPERPSTLEEQKDLLEIMEKNNISIVMRDPSVPKQTRGQRAAATRRARRAVRENGGSTERDGESDNMSVSSVEAPTVSENGSDKSEESPPTVFRTRDLPPTTSTPTTSNNNIRSVGTSPLTNVAKTSVSGTPTTPGTGKKRRRKSCDEKKLAGPRRSYPDRKRRPPSFFE